ncbi:methyltransferase domain-containing protein [Flavimarina sp. Hel_I_48]|uniref:methyltransferase domain-containing protein n=1 Tax=Flavimarina sp. Hel_I_48 TaxID=1392488 RepID=UPI0004DF94AA|nr:methyltransferase domain-containing protein [Flavimarina sp. Hel_I_48]
MKTRILKPELMDDPQLEESKLHAALQDVTLVNKWLGGQQITLDGIDYFFKKYPQKSYTIADLGCGDGEILRKMAVFCQKKGINASFVGFDLNAKSIVLAQKRSIEFPEISFRQQDILKLGEKEEVFDIMTSTLTMHHFTDEEILNFLRFFEQRSTLGWVINDLQRSRTAAVLFRAFSGVFMKTKIARYDGLVSIGRAFTKKELIIFATKLGLEHYKLKWRWAFRYLWIVDSKA